MILLPNAAVRCARLAVLAGVVCLAAPAAASAVPETTITSGPPDPTNNPTPTFVFSNPDSTAQFECSLDDRPVEPCPSPHLVAPALGDGAHVFRVRAISGTNPDPETEPAIWPFTVDTVAPDTTIDSKPSALTNDATPTFEFSSPEPGAGFECRHLGPGDAAFADCSSPHTLGSLDDGAYVFEVRAFDAAGNPDGSAASLSFRVDTTPPQTEITGGPGDTTAANAVFLFSSPGAGRFECRLDGGVWRPCDSPHSYSNLSLGPHRFEVKGIDEAANEERTPAAHSWQVLRPGLVIPAALKQATALATELIQMRKALARVRLRALRRRRAVTLRRFDALTGGTVEVRASARVRRRRITILVGKRDIPRAGRYPIRARVTRKGRRLMRGRRRLAVELRLSFTDLAGRSLWATTKLTMKR
jgi:hypothetical protein